MGVQSTIVCTSNNYMIISTKAVETSFTTEGKHIGDVSPIVSYSSWRKSVSSSHMLEWINFQIKKFQNSKDMTVALLLQITNVILLCLSSSNEYN